MAAIVCALVPVMLALMDKEALNARSWVGLLLGLLGVGVLTNPLDGHMHFGAIGALLLATVLWSFCTLHGKHHVKGHALFRQVSVQMLTAGVIGLVVAPFTGGYLHHAATGKAVFAVGYLALFGSLVAFTAYVHLAKLWAPAKMGTYAYLNPLVAVILGGAFLHEPFSARMALGMAIILAGVAVVQLKPSIKMAEAVEDIA